MNKTLLNVQHLMILWQWRFRSWFSVLWHQPV